MRFLTWIPRWIVSLVLLTSLHAHSHMLHYLHLKKFLTAVAFARALGKRPTILPIPVPIPIPIAQNEVIKIPIAGGGKTMILDGNKGESSKGIGLSQLIGGGLPPIDFTGSSPYGYAVPGISTPGAIQASDSSVVNLASAFGGGNGSPRIIVLGGQGSGLAQNSGGGPTIIKLNDVGASNLQFGTGGANLGLNALGGNGLIPGMSGDLQPSFSMKQPLLFHRPFNVYSDKPRRKFPLAFRGRRTNNNNLSGAKFHSEKYGGKTYDNRYLSSQEQQNTPAQDKHRKPIPVGEKFTYRP